MCKDCHRFSNPCTSCVAENSTRYHETNGDKTIARLKLNQENTKNVGKAQSQQIEEPNKKNRTLNRGFGNVGFKNLNSSISISKCHS